MGVFDSVTDLFSIGNTISQSSNTKADDVIKTKTALAETGHYTVPSFGITDTPDMAMIDGIKGFQQQNDLQVDGVMRPGGPTENKIADTLAGQGIGNTDLLETVKPVKPKPPTLDPLTGLPKIKMPKLKKKTADLWGQTSQQNVTKPNKWFQSKKLIPVEDESHSANTRSMDGLLKSKVNGTLPYLYADSIKRDGDKAINEYANFMQQLSGRKNERADEFHTEVITRLPNNLKQKFTDLEMNDAPNETTLDKNAGYELPERYRAFTPERIQQLQAAYEQNPESFIKKHDQQNQRPQTKRPLESDSITSSTMSVQNVDDEKTSQTHPYDDGKTPTQRRYNRRKDVGERNLDAKEDRLRTGSRIGRKIGLGDAADHLDKFLDGDDTDRTVHRDEARKDPFIRRAEEKNRERYKERTFTGTTRNPELNRKLRNLKDGESVEFKDGWDHGQGDFDSVVDNARMGFKDGANNYLKYGRQALRSRSKIRATRRGNKIHYEGNVDHNADDDYDFHDGRTGDMTGAKDLEDAGRGKKYTTKRRWKQKVRGSVDIDGWKNGEGHVLRRPKVKWDDFE